MTTETSSNPVNGIGDAGGTAWRPIETAPRDGTYIRLGHERDASSMKPDTIFPIRGRWHEIRWQMSAFFLVPGGRHGLMATEPTHWQPLPTPEARHD